MDKTEAPWFMELGDRFRAEGKLFKCPDCGHERTKDLCLECEDNEMISKNTKITTSKREFSS